MNRDEARERVVEAIRNVDPDALGPLGRIGNAGVRTDERNGGFDVSVTNATNHLVPEYESAIGEALGSKLATFRVL
jgi:hypothetical protein